MKLILASCRPIKFSWIALVAAVGLILSITAVKAQTPGAASRATSPTGNPKNGGELYLKYSCYACHGYSGQNGPGTRLVPTRMTQHLRAVRLPEHLLETTTTESGANGAQPSAPSTHSADAAAGQPEIGRAHV